jgi:DNA-directed RNA polymerase specialized sigma24 family protein
MSDLTPDVVPDGSVTVLVRRLKGGDAAAAGPLWDAYFARLVGLARARMRSAPWAADDGEDAALSAFDSFCTRAGGLADLNDRDDLWRYLSVITKRKAVALVRRATAGRRHPGPTVPLAPDAGGADPPDPDPTPDLVAEVKESCDRLLGLLDDGLRRIAVWKVEGLTNAEVAARLGKSVPTVERKLRVIRETWEKKGVDR